MTYGFALALFGGLALISALRDRSMTDVLRGITSPRSGGAGEGGFARALLDGTNRALGGRSFVSDVTPGAQAGLVNFEGTQMCGWIAAELKIARQNGGKLFQVTSGHRTPAEQAAACAHTSGPCAAPGTSNHQGTRYPGCAIDVSNPEDLHAHLRPGSPLKWTGRSIGDDVHFSSGKRGV